MDITFANEYGYVTNTIKKRSTRYVVLLILQDTVTSSPGQKRLKSRHPFSEQANQLTSDQ